MVTVYDTLNDRALSKLDTSLGQLTYVSSNIQVCQIPLHVAIWFCLVCLVHETPWCWHLVYASRHKVIRAAWYIYTAGPGKQIFIAVAIRQPCRLLNTCTQRLVNLRKSHGYCETVCLRVVVIVHCWHTSIALVWCASIALVWRASPSRACFLPFALFTHSLSN